MPTACTQCGVLLSLPSRFCQMCGHAVGKTFDPYPTTSPLTPDESSHVGEARETYFPPAISEVNTDEGSAVERLLEQIAEQSHFEERYEVRAELASGGMGKVTRAFDRILRREVAIKMMHENLGGTSGNVALRGQFLKEARIGGRLLHPNILSVFDLGVNRLGQIYYSMRLVDGASLQHCLDSLDKGVVTKLISFPLYKIVEALVGACRGVDYAHQNKVIHLDLKPQNMLISGFQEFFVIDWGLARIDEVDDTERLAGLYRDRTNHRHGHTMIQTGVFGNGVVGTPGYMAPEQARGDYQRYGASTDVFGLGGILYFVLYGKPPNQGRSMRDVLEASLVPKERAKLRQGILPRGLRIKKDVLDAIEALERICLKALAVEQEDRYEDVEKLIIDLDEWQAANPSNLLGT